MFKDVGKSPIYFFLFNTKSIAKRKEEKIDQERGREGDYCCRSFVFAVTVAAAGSVLVPLFLLCYYSSLSISPSLYFLHLVLLRIAHVPLSFLVLSLFPFSESLIFVCFSIQFHSPKMINCLKID